MSSALLHHSAQPFFLTRSTLQDVKNIFSTPAAGWQATLQKVVSLFLSFLTLPTLFIADLVNAPLQLCLSLKHPIFPPTLPEEKEIEGGPLPYPSQQEAEALFAKFPQGEGECLCVIGSILSNPKKSELNFNRLFLQKDCRFISFQKNGPSLAEVLQRTILQALTRALDHLPPARRKKQIEDLKECEPDAIVWAAACAAYFYVHLASLHDPHDFFAPFSFSEGRLFIQYRRLSLQDRAYIASAIDFYIKPEAIKVMDIPKPPEEAEFLRQTLIDILGIVWHQNKNFAEALLAVIRDLNEMESPTCTIL